VVIINKDSLVLRMI